MKRPKKGKDPRRRRYRELSVFLKRLRKENSTLYIRDHGLGGECLLRNLRSKLARGAKVMMCSRAGGCTPSTVQRPGPDWGCSLAHCT